MNNEPKDGGERQTDWAKSLTAKSWGKRIILPSVILPSAQVCELQPNRREFCSAALGASQAAPWVSLAKAQTPATRICKAVKIESQPD
jgi:hypothetical protein